jgi:RES domain
MAPRDLPSPDFPRRALELIDHPAGSVWQRIYDDKYSNSLGVGRGLSRFSDPTGTRFGLLYLASTTKGAFAEAVLRDRALGITAPFLMTMAELESYICADIEIKESLKLVDLTGDGHIRLRVPTDVTRASDQTLARIWSEAFYYHPSSPDGVVYGSRLTGERNIALYDRAVRKLASKSVPKLIDRRNELADIINSFKLAII